MKKTFLNSLKKYMYTNLVIQKTKTRFIGINMLLHLYTEGILVHKLLKTLKIKLVS